MGPIRVKCGQPVDFGLRVASQFRKMQSVVVVLVDERHAGVVADEMVVPVQPVLFLLRQLIPHIVELLGVLGQWPGQRVLDRRRTGRHLDGTRQLLVDGGCPGHNRVQPSLQLGQLRDHHDHRVAYRGGGHHPARHGVDGAFRVRDIGLERSEIVLDLLHVIGGLTRRPGHRQRLVALRVEVAPQLLIGLSRGLRRIAAPGPERGQRRDAVGGFKRRLGPIARGVKHLANIAGLPAFDIGDRDRHCSEPLGAEVDAVLDGLHGRCVVFLGRHILLCRSA